MTKLTFSRLPVWLSVMLSVGIMFSCSKDDESTQSRQVLLESFGPTGAKHGDTLRFIGRNLDKVTAIQFTGTGATVEKKDFKKQSSDLILLLVPQSAEKGKVTLKTSDGDVVTKTQLNLDVTVTVNTMTTQARPGDNITLSGSYLNWVSKITFTGDKVVQTFVSKSMNQLVVTVPGEAKTGQLIISYGGTDSADISTKDSLKVVLPAVTNMTPNPVDPDTDLTITGTNLDLVSSIAFAGVVNPVSTFVSKTASQIVVKVPTATLKGKLKLFILSTTAFVESSVELAIKGNLPPLADFPAASAIYTDALQNTFQDWSYTDTHDFNSTVNVRQGTKSVRAVYQSGGYQGVTFHASTNLPTAGRTTLEFSVYGEAGTGGKKLNVVVNGNYGSPPQVTVKEAEWTTFTLTLASLGSPATIGEIVLQSAGWGGTLHIDHVGLR